MKVGTLCHQKSKLLFLFFLSFSLFFGGMVAGDDDGEEDINGDCQSGSEATFSLYEDVFKDGEPIQTIIRHENSSCTSVYCPGDIYTFFRNVYSSTDKVFNIGKIEGLCVVLEDTSLSQCDLNFRVNDLTSNSDRDTFVVSGLTSTLYNSTLGLSGGTGLWRGLIGSTFVYPSNKGKGRTWTFTMCLSTEDCNGGQLVFQQEESIREFDGEIDSPGTISLFEGLLTSDINNFFLGMDNGRCILIPVTNKEKPRQFCQWVVEMSDKNDLVFMQGTVYDYFDKGSYVSIVGGTGFWERVRGGGEATFITTDLPVLFFDMELFYGCQRNATELVLKENSPSLVYLPDGPSAVGTIILWSDIVDMNMDNTTGEIHGVCYNLPSNQNATDTFCSWTFLLPDLNNTLSVFGTINLNEPESYGVTIGGGSGEYNGIRGQGTYSLGTWSLQYSQAELPEFAAGSSLFISLFLSFSAFVWNVVLL